MKFSRGVFNTDQVNLDRMRFPASELMREYQNRHRGHLCGGGELGLPMHIQHDMHRPIGWSRLLGLYVDGEMVRVLGETEEAKTDEEFAEIRNRCVPYWQQFHRDGTSPFRDDLTARVAPAEIGNASFLQMEAAVLKRQGIAAELYPELFTPSAGLVDKDGLVDYRVLLQRTEQVQPGVFHDRTRDLLLFVHRFFRRSLSHRNKLNSDFLRNLDSVAREKSDLRVRIRLDPDLVGHPASARNLIELEYWRGPHFNDDITHIPNGVAEHKADSRVRFFEGIDRTQIWWKELETRFVENRQVQYRTFEIEELIENPSGGLDDKQFGCRYAHAEYSGHLAAISHFDGAIRAYDWAPYLERIEASIDRAGKQADYTKVFRIDGALAIPEWKQLLTNFFRGNKLIPEYLGALEKDEPGSEPNPPSALVAPASESPLAVLITLKPGSISVPIQMWAELCQECAGEVIPFVEVGIGAVEKLVRSRIDLSEITSVGFKDDILNLSRLAFGGPCDLKAVVEKETKALADALEQDGNAGIIRRAAIPLAWEEGGLVVTLTVAGDANKVAKVLQDLSTVIDPTRPPSEWIEALSNLIKSTIGCQHFPIIWHGVDRGILAIERSGVVEQQLRVPNAIRDRILSSAMSDSGS